MEKFDLAEGMFQQLHATPVSVKNKISLAMEYLAQASADLIEAEQIEEANQISDILSKF